MLVIASSHPLQLPGSQEMAGRGERRGFRCGSAIIRIAGPGPSHESKFG